MEQFHWSSVKAFDRVGMYYFPKDQWFHTILQFNLNRTRTTRIWRIYFRIRADPCHPCNPCSITILLLTDDTWEQFIYFSGWWKRGYWQQKKHLMAWMKCCTQAGGVRRKFTQGYWNQLNNWQKHETTRRSPDKLQLKSSRSNTRYPRCLNSSFPSTFPAKIFNFPFAPVRCSLHAS